MNMRQFNSAAAPAPRGGYSQVVEVTGAQRIVFISGQIPETSAGNIPSEFREQAELAWKNVFIQLEAANMTAANLAKVTTFLSAREYALVNREVRQHALGQHAPALTVIIAGIFDERWLLEIEAVAVA